MADQTLPADTPSESICPWCSAAVVPGSPTCASCGAILESDEDRDVPGLTAIDPGALRPEAKPASGTGSCPGSAANTRTMPRRRPRPRRWRRRMQKSSARSSASNWRPRSRTSRPSATPFCPRRSWKAGSTSCHRTSSPWRPASSTPIRSPQRRPTRMECPPRPRDACGHRHRVDPRDSRRGRVTARRQGAVRLTSRLSCGRARSPPIARSVVHPRASRPCPQRHVAGRHGPAVRRTRRLVAGGGLGHRTTRASSASGTSRLPRGRHRIRRSGGSGPRSAAHSPA